VVVFSRPPTIALIFTSIGSGESGIPASSVAVVLNRESDFRGTATVCPAASTRRDASVSGRFAERLTRSTRRRAPSPPRHLHGSRRPRGCRSGAAQGRWAPAAHVRYLPARWRRREVGAALGGANLGAEGHSGVPERRSGQEQELKKGPGMPLVRRCPKDGQNSLVARKRLQRLLGAVGRGTGDRAWGYVAPPPGCDGK